VFAALLFVVAAPASAVTAGAEHMTVYDSAEETEPALISQARSGVDYVVTVYMKFDPDINAIPTLEYAAYNSNGASTHGALPTVGLTYYNAIFDPVLAQREGVTNPRIYLAAIGENEGLNSTNDTAVILWSSDDGGWSWSAPSVIASEARASGKFDKTAIAVGPDGSVHVAWINANASGTLSYRSGTYDASNDTLAWSNPPTNVVGTTGNFFAPQVMVDANNDVYILYVDGNLNNILLTRKDAGGTGFDQVTPIPNTGALYGSVVLRIDFITLTTSVSIRATTIPVARLDRTNGRIAAAWHESDGAGHSQIRFASLETDEGKRTWTNPLVIAAAGGHDINVGMAKDDLGNWLVTYYSFPINDSYYSPVGTTVYFSGDTPMHDNGNNRIIGRLGDIADLHDSPPGSGQRYLGDYHDVSYSLGTFKSAHIIVAPIANPWIFEATQ
jgi:hypothetical protein